MDKIFGNVVSVTYEWKVYIRVGHFVNSERERQKQTGDRTEKKEELEGKGQVLLEGRGTIGCYSVVSVIVGVQPFRH